MTAVIRLEDIMKTYVMGDAVVHALDHVSVEIGVGEFTSIMGPSGSGKSTMMNILGCLDRPTSGQYYLDGKEVAGYSDDELARTRNAKIGFVFQNFNLLPKLSAQLNVALPLVYAGIGEEERLERAKTALEAVGLGDRIDHNPTEMSGGQRQRVALGRAIVRSPQVFLLDEPLSNLDAKLRAQMRTEIAKLHQKLGTTFIYVTHDQTEAMTMGDRIVVMKDGIIQQVDTPQALYEKPCNKFVAGFLGSPQMNFVESVLRKNGSKYVVEFGSADTKSTRGVIYSVELPEAKIVPELANYVDKEIIMGIRPESVHDEEMYLSNASTGIIECDVDITEMMGAETFLYLTCQGIPLTARVSPRSKARPQDKIKVAIDPNRVHLFDKDTEATIIN